MNEEAIFERDGERFVPGRHAIGPWAADRLHGGPILGLIARAVEAADPDPELVLARLTVDMFRPLAAAPLALRTESLRKGSRLALLRVTVAGADGTDLVQGTALLLRASAGESVRSALAPGDPGSLPTESLMRGLRDPARPGGFHTRVETRWPPRAAGEPLAIWFRMPIPLVAGEPASSLVRAVAVSDFANAVPSIAASARSGGRGTPYINADTTLYLTRRPEGEWFCLQERATDAERGIGTAAVQLYDQRGPLGHALQSRIAVR